MHAFSLRGRSWWIMRAFGRNPLLRWTDRTEACVIVFAILVALAATPVCAAAGVGVYRSHARLYAEQSLARHSVTATVVEKDPRPHQPRSTGVTVLAMWLVAADGARGGEIEVAHTGWVSRDRAVNAGDRIDVWVDDAGAPVAPPTPPSQAWLDAVGYGAGIWLVAALGLTAAVGMVRSPLNRIRRVQWEGDIKGFTDGQRSSRPY
ncbi:MAG: hypothetical protein QOD59_5884 [Mycobacterium sp.]|jgi:hypothetical protein|nr:hypothetical protein [Mycobacterium sp.]